MFRKPPNYLESSRNAERHFVMIFSATAIGRSKFGLYGVNAIGRILQKHNVAGVDVHPREDLLREYHHD